MAQRNPLYSLFVVAILVFVTTFGVFAVKAQSEPESSDAAVPKTEPLGDVFEPEQMTAAMANMVEQMETMMAAAPGDTDRRMMAPAMTQMLTGMIGLNQYMLAQMQSSPEGESETMAPSMMAVTGRMADMMNQMHATIGGGMSMMGGSMAITDTMSMSGTTSMMDAGMMRGAQSPQMMAMMAQMMAMMNQMHAMTGDGMGSNMMGGSMAITDTMPMSGTTSMMDAGMMRGAQSPQMMAMMAQMMAMMSQMHATTGDGMMGGTMIDDATTSTTEASNTVFETQSAEVGGVTVEVTPLNLHDMAAESLDFQIVLNTHSVELDQDLAEIAVLLVDDLEYTASRWDGSSGGHHVSGQLSFGVLKTANQPILADVGSISLVIRDLAGIDERIFTWDLAE